MNLETNSNNSIDLDLDFSAQGAGVKSLESYLEEEDIITGGDDSKNDINKHLVIGEDDDPNRLEFDKIVEEEEEDDDDTTPPLMDKDKVVDLEIDTDTKGTSNSIDYKETLKYLMTNNVIGEIEGIEAEDGSIIPFEEMEVDAETFAEIIRVKQEEERSNLLKDKVSTKNMSEFTQKLVEIEANGGNVAQALETYQKYKNPLENLDLNLESDQQAVVYLKLQASGIPDADIVDLIKTYKANGELENKAVKAKEELETAVNRQLEDINKQALARKEQQKEMLKKYRDSLNDNLKTFELSDSYKKKLLDVATKEDEKGKFELDRIYSEIRQDPKQAAELVLFLTNKEEYLKQVTESIKRETTINNFKTIKIVPKGKSNLKIDTGNKSDDSKNYIDLNKI